MSTALQARTTIMRALQTAEPEAISALGTALWLFGEHKLADPAAITYDVRTAYNDRIRTCLEFVMPDPKPEKL